MASTALLKVRFPDGTIRYGRYHVTSDVPSLGLVDVLDGWDTLPLRWTQDAPEGHPVPVQIACDYGGGFWWCGTALPDRLVDSGYRIEGLEEVRAPIIAGYPDWWDEPAKESGQERAHDAAMLLSDELGGIVLSQVHQISFFRHKPFDAPIAAALSAFARLEVVRMLEDEANEREAHGNGAQGLGYYGAAMAHANAAKRLRALAAKYKESIDDE